MSYAELLSIFHIARQIYRLLNPIWPGLLTIDPLHDDLRPQSKATRMNKLLLIGQIGAGLVGHPRLSAREAAR